MITHAGSRCVVSQPSTIRRAVVSAVGDGADARCCGRGGPRSNLRVRKEAANILSGAAFGGLSGGIEAAALRAPQPLRARVAHVEDAARAAKVCVHQHQPSCTSVSCGSYGNEQARVGTSRHELVRVRWFSRHFLSAYSSSLRSR